VSLRLVSELFRYGSQAGQLILLVCLLRRHLAARYRFFCGFVCAQLLESVALFGIDSHSTLYATIWSIAQIPVWVFQVLAIIELMSHVFEHYPRIGQFANVIVSSSFVIGALVAGCITVIELPGSAPMKLSLLLSWEVTKYLAWISFTVLGVQAIWFALFPVPMRPNVRLHRLLFTWYAGLSPGILILVAASRKILLVDIANVCLLGSAVICISIWTTQMRTVGEVEPYIPHISSAELAAIEADFEASSKILARITRRELFR
jgi:hypothetical protein